VGQVGQSVPEGYARVFSVLEARCPDRVPPDRWKQAVADGQHFLARWGEQAEALGWAARDLFGLIAIPDHAAPSFDRLSRYDEMGLCWLLRGREVIAITEARLDQRDHHLPPSQQAGAWAAR
jgi:hypothetical protein